MMAPFKFLVRMSCWDERRISFVEFHRYWWENRILPSWKHKKTWTNVPVESGNWKHSNSCSKERHMAELLYAAHRPHGFPGAWQSAKRTLETWSFVFVREKKDKHMPRAGAQREKKENCLLRLLMQEKLREGWVFFVQILALVKALSIKMWGLFNPALQERHACFVIKQNFIKAMSHIIL